ncbi:MAG: ATP-dependent zinc metalloprotease FtsH, partial [Planctomycetota bacterium]
MTSNQSKDAGDGQGPRKPRGMGGVVLILALLMALFLVVSGARGEGVNSVHAFYSHLLNGRVERLSVADGVATAEVRVGEGMRQIEVVVRDFLRAEGDNEIELYSTLSTQRLDPTLFSGPAATADFKNQVDAGEVLVLRAFLVQESEGKSPTLARPGAPEPRQAGSYLTALLQRGSKLHYVRLDAPAAGEGAPLQECVAALAKKGVKVRTFALSLGNDFRISEPNTALLYVVGTVGPWLLVLVIVWFFILRQMRSPGGAGGVLSFGRSRAHLYTKENRTNITFDDVAGMEEAKAEVREIIEFLKNPGKFARLGGSIPRGVLLVGSPGTGKTLLAKAIAGEAEVPFFSISGSDFVEMFVGVGASRVRDLFKQAKENSPCIIFLDEIDAVGRRRGGGFSSGGHDEREQTLNAILVEMDGFDANTQVIVIASTNRPDVLDPALTRPGRFDRQVAVNLPDLIGRRQILAVHSKKVKLAPDVDLEKVARGTPMFSGADLAALINEAAIIATMADKDFVELADLEEARDKVRFGRANKSRKIEQQERVATAYHEAGHAVLQVLLEHADPLHKVTIIPRGQAMGATFSLPEKDRYGFGRKHVLATLRVLCGGRIAEERKTGDTSSGASMDIRMATQYARAMILQWGMSDRLGFVNYAGSDTREMFLPEKDYSPETARIIDEETRRLIDEAYEEARRILDLHWDKVAAVADALLKYETLSKDDVDRIMRGEMVAKPSVAD